MVTCPAYFGDRSFQENKSPQMPLTRLNDSAFDAQLEGVYFGMWNGSTSVRCFVSHEALTDKAQGSGQAESLDVFHEHRSEIENLASAKYDAGKIKSDGLVVVLFSGDGDFRSLVEAVQRRGVRVTVVSTISTQPPMVAAELRRQADVFLDIVELQPKIGRDPAERAAPEAREPRDRHTPQFLQRPTAPQPSSKSSSSSKGALGRGRSCRRGSRERIRRPKHEAGRRKTA
jgi:hypothetical protein